MNFLRFKILSVIILSFSMLNAQQTPFQEQIGYINITSDTSNVPIYVDGILVGHSPLAKPIPVLPGNHTIGIYPISIKNTFTQYGLDETQKQIFAFNGDTIKVHLNSFLINQHFKQQKNAVLLSRYINIGIGMLFLCQLWILSN